MRCLSRAVLAGALVLLAACGGGGAPASAQRASDAAADSPAAGASPAPAAESPPAAGAEAAAPPAGAAVLKDRVHHPAELHRVSLAELGIDDPDGAATASPAGAVAAALVHNGHLRYATAGDNGFMQQGGIQIQAGGKAYVLPIILWTSLPAESESPDHGGENGEPARTSPPLVVSGLSAQRAIGTQPLRFRASDGLAPDPARSDGLATDVLGREVQLHEYWTHDAADRSFVIAGEALARLRAALAPGVVRLEVGWKGQTKSRFYMLPVVRANARLTGRLADPEGLPAARLAGRPVLLTESAEFPRIRRVATVGEDGGFAFDDLPAGVYRLLVGDLVNFGILGATVEVYPDSTAVSVRMTDSLALPAPRDLAKAAPVRGSLYIDTVEQDGTPPPARGGVPGQAPAGPQGPPSGGVQAGSAARERAGLAGGAAPAKPAAGGLAGLPAWLGASPAAPKASDCASREPDGTGNFVAISSTAGQSVRCDVSYTVPQGTELVGVQVQVDSHEYPKYTQPGSRYNDTWRFSVQDLGLDYMNQSASVVSSHRSEGSTRWYACIDTAKRAAAGPFTLNGVAEATGVGDNLQPTSVRIRVGTRCDLNFKVTSATFSSPGVASQPIISPTNTEANLSGRYLSIAAERVAPTYRLPLRIGFSPSRARIEKIELGMQDGAAPPVFAAENLLAQSPRIAAGEIDFGQGLVLPQWPAAGRIANEVQLVVRLTGTLDGRQVVSDAVAGGRAQFGGDTTFTLLYPAHTERGLAARRYGGPPDPGGDGWATAQTIDWLASKPYRFNDVSAQHVLQTPGGRSVLHHKGHSDGQQIDLRYADGQGGFTDPMGGASEGAHIRAVLDRARAEVRDAAAEQPNLARIKGWVQANRQVIGAQAAAPEVRKVFVGDDWMEALLIGGRFPDGTAVPGLGAWAKSGKIQSAESHLHHWHVSLDLRPKAAAAAR